MNTYLHNVVSVVLLASLIIISACVRPKHLTPADIRKATYTIPDVGKVQFKDGRNGNVGLVDLYAFGDLNGDGLEDAVTFTANNPGGSGIFISLEALLNDGGTPEHVASHLIGDRIGIDSVKIVDGIIDLHIVTQGPDDPMCCPKMHVERKLYLKLGELREVGAQK